MWAQPELPLEHLDLRAVPGAVWVMACPDADFAEFTQQLQTRRTLFLDSVTGEAAVGDDDLLLIRSSSGGEYSVYGRYAEAPAPCGGRLPSVDERQPLVSSGGGVSNLLAICFGAEGLCDREPPLDGTGLERLISTVRHPALAQAHDARYDRVSAAREVLKAHADRALLGLLDREAADAARALLSRPSDPVQRELIRDLHRRAGSELRDRGFIGQAALTTALMINWMGPEQLPFEFLAPVTTSALGEGRVPYRAHRVIGHRFSAPQLAAASRRKRPAGSRRLLERIIVPDRMMCEWVTGLASRRLKHWHHWLDPARPGPLELDVGLDTDFSVLMGLAGKTGEKDENYTLRAWGRDCNVTQDRLECSVGAPTRLTVSGGGAGSEIDLELSTGSGLRTNFRLGVPFAEVRPPAGALIP